MNSILNYILKDSNGNDYMSMLHCANEDIPVVIGIILACIYICYQYGDIAFKHYINYKKYPSTKLSSYFFGITKVFVFCALAGYGYRIMSVWYNPYKILLLILIGLNYYTFSFRKAFRSLDVFFKLHSLEDRFGAVKKQMKEMQEKLVVDLFDNKNISMITFSSLDLVPYNEPFDSDGNGNITNTRIDEAFVGFSAISVMKPNSYVDPHQHDADKTLKCTKGSFYDSNTNKWYKEGEYLFIPKATEECLLDNWHDIKAGPEGCELLTHIMPK